MSPKNLPCQDSLVALLVVAEAKDWQAVSKLHPSEAPTPRIVIPAKAGIQGSWRGATAVFPRSTPPGFPLSRE